MNVNRTLIAAASALLLLGLVGAAAAADQTPYNGLHATPGRIQAEDYDNGGAGVAYSDTTSGNTGGAGRLTEAVDIETVNGITNIGWIIGGEWTEYTVTVPATGTYTANFRVGSWSAGHQIALTIDGAPGCTVAVPNTGSSEAYTTVPTSLPLSAGTHVIRLTYIGSGQNIDWFEIVGGASATTAPTNAVPTSATIPSGQTPYNGLHAFPGRVQAEDYDNGGAGVAYSDTTSGNTGGAGRLTEAVDIETVNGITNIGWIIGGEWTEYTVTVPATGTYTANFRVGSWSAGHQIALTIDGAPGCTVAVPNTGSSEAYTTVPTSLPLSAGTHVIRLTYIGSGQNIDWFEIVGGGTVNTPTTSVPGTTVTAIPASGTTPVTLSQAGARLDAATAAGNARLASIQAAYHAWAIPSRPDLVAVATNAKSSGLKGDGATDDTAALQALLNRLPTGSTVYFPPSTYRIDGPVSITKSVTLVGAPGTIFNCQRATQNVFSIRGSSSAKLGGITVTGITVEGPGLETDPAMFTGYYLQNAHFSYMKFHNVGLRAIGLFTCTDVVVEDCVFDNVFKTGYGYGVAVVDASDRITVRDSFFVTKGRHGVTTGGAVRGLTVENNYFEYTTQGALDAHPGNVGPYVVKNNVMNHCFVDIGLHSGTAVITDNLFINNAYRCIELSNEVVSPTSLGTKVDHVERNSFININRGVSVANTNLVIQDNILKGGSSSMGIWLFGTATPRTCIVQGNLMNGFTQYLEQTVSNPYLSNTGNIVKAGTSWQYLKV